MAGFEVSTNGRFWVSPEDEAYVEAIDVVSILQAKAREILRDNAAS